MKTLFSIIILCCLMNTVIAQDIILMKDGQEIKSKVTEVLTKSVKYKKFENLDGPVYTVDKNTVFMIKYANGSKDVFSAEKSLVNNNSENESATIYFYRPKKMASSSAKIIIGTSDPDEVVVKLRNGSWYKTEYTHIGNRNFLAGVFIINPETFDIEIEPGETYYFKCTILSKGFKIMAEMETMEKETAEEDMKKLKEQTKNYVN